MTRSSSEFTRRNLLKTVLFGSALPLASQGSIAADAPAGSGRKVRGVIFMVSDGMSPGVLTLAEAYSKLTRNRGTRWWQLYSDPKAARGLMDTASASSLVTDSAAASSAWGSGKRIANGVINIDSEGKELTPIAAVLKRKPQTRIGLVTTATVTHATPAGFAAAVPDRDLEDLIAPQYRDRVDLILGGGAKFFSRESRTDGHELWDDFSKSGYQVVRDRDGLLNSQSAKLLGIFSKGHLPFEIDRIHNSELAKSVPTLKEMASAAVGRFLSQDQPFLLQIEGARIDHAAHLNDIAALLGEQLAFDDAVAAVLEAVAGRDDLLVVVTSDHGNSNPGLIGVGEAYSQSTEAFAKIQRAQVSHESLITAWKASEDRDPSRLAARVEMGLGVLLKDAEAAALAEVFASGHAAEWNHQLANPEGLLGQFCGNHTGIGWVGTTHTTDPTLISVIGPQAERFNGMVVNSKVFEHLVELLG